MSAGDAARACIRMRCSDLPADVARPRYDRAALQPGIVHLGLGAFLRAHLAAANDAALDAAQRPALGHRRRLAAQPDTRDALAPQHGLYTLALREPTTRRAPALQVDRLPARAAGRARRPGRRARRASRTRDTRIVSLTVTEKGYCHDPASGALQLRRIPTSPTTSSTPTRRAARSASSCTAWRCAARAAAAAVTLLSLRQPAGQRRHAARPGAGASPSASATGWPTGSSASAVPEQMVDRIVPRSTDADRARRRAALGLRRRLAGGRRAVLRLGDRRPLRRRPAGLAAGGARFVADAEPFERLKLRMVNGSALGAGLPRRAGRLAHGRRGDRRAARCGDYVDALLRDEVAPTLAGAAPARPRRYRARLLQRFANPALAHRTAQIAMDGSQKLPQRLLGTVRDRLAAGADRAAGAGVAAWIHYLRGLDEAGRATRWRTRWRAELAPRTERRAYRRRRSARPRSRARSPLHRCSATSARSAARRRRWRGPRSLRERGVLATLDSL